MPETSLRPTQPCSIALPPSSCRCPDREHDRDSPPQRLPQARSHSQPARAIWQRLSGAGLTETSPTVREAPARTCRDPARDCTSPIRGQHPRRALARLPPMLHTPDETKTAQTRFLARLAGCHRRLQVGASLGLGFGDRMLRLQRLFVEIATARRRSCREGRTGGRSPSTSRLPKTSWE
jgi:hypothetical protein